jgi:putative DNA primase/helicase
MVNHRRRFRIEQMAEALGATQVTTAARRTAVPKLAGTNDKELKRLITTGESFHGPIVSLAFRWVVLKGDDVNDVIARLKKLMKRVDEDKRDARWSDRYKSIKCSVLELLEKFPEARVKQLLRQDRYKAIIDDEENVWRVLENDENIQGILRYDAFMCQRVVVRPIPGDECDEKVVTDTDAKYPRFWRDDDTVSVQRYVQRKYIVRIGREKVDAVINEWAIKRWSFHPIRDYLDRLKWDDKPRIDTWLVDYMGAHDAPPEYLTAIGSKWLIAGVARIYDPGCKVDTMLVLEGAQGKKKSMGLRELAGAEHFSDSVPTDLASKDARDHIRGKWIIEMSELAQFRKSEIETVKAFLSRQVEQFRPAFGRGEITYLRQCIIAGSTNASQYLVDDTGNRRFWIAPTGTVKIAALRRDRDQLWAEAVHRYRKGEKWWLTPKIEALAAEQADARRIHDPWQDEIEMMLRTGSLKKVTRVKPSDVLSKMDLTTQQRTPIYAVRVAKILNELKWRRPTPSSRFFERPKASDEQE